MRHLTYSYSLDLLRKIFKISCEIANEKKMSKAIERTKWKVTIKRLE